MLERPAVMAVLNASPDSFYRPGGSSGGAGKPSPGAFARLAGELLDAGADLLDLGGMSSRPGAEFVSEQEEADRVLPAVEAVCAMFPDALVSVDTWRAAVARQAVLAGAGMVNDISAGRLDKALWPAVAELRVPYVLMHMQGLPRDMQDDPVYDDVVVEVFDFLQERLDGCRRAGIADVILDPGFGFGKTLDHNFALLARLGEFRALGCPLLAGMSRKSMVCRALGVDPPRALHGTTVLNTLALLDGASVLRVHDPREAAEAVELVRRFREASPDPVHAAFP